MDRVHGLEFNNGDLVHLLGDDDLESSYVVYEFQENNGIAGCYWLYPNDPKIKSPYDTNKSTTTCEDEMVSMSTWNKLNPVEKAKYRMVYLSRFPEYWLFPSY